MLFEEPTAKEHLSRIVQRVSRNPSWHDDLMQEGIIHLWRIETQKPGHTLSWYLQSCLFHLMNRLGAGRSADSVKRQHCLDSLSAQGENFLPEIAGDSSVLSDVSAREIVMLLTHVLPPVDRTILACLVDGFCCREIARKLRISHPAVIKRRRGIAALASQFGIMPLAKNHKLQSRTVRSVAGIERQATT